MLSCGVKADIIWNHKTGDSEWIAAFTDHLSATLDWLHDIYNQQILINQNNESVNNGLLVSALIDTCLQVRVVA